MDRSTIPPSRIIALSLGVGVFFIAQGVLTSLVSGRPMVFMRDVLQLLFYWSTWALVSPVVIAMARRWPLEAKPVFRSVLPHASAALLLAAVQTIGAFSLHWVALRLAESAGVPSELTVWLSQRSTQLIWGLFMDVFLYWVIVGVYAATHFRRLYASERANAAEATARSAALEVQLTRAQLDALRSQLRPHFLFNTLNAISVLTIEDPTKARHVLLRLGSLLRHSLDEDRNEVPLARELALLNDYLDIQRVRFGDRLSVSVDVDPSVTDTPVPVLLLQPLVENAIAHGMPDGAILRPGGGHPGETATISVRAALVAGALRITVEDNGPGPGGRGPRTGAREGVGLRNTRERLQGLYGSRATLRLRAVNEAGRDRGTCVEIILPLASAEAAAVPVPSAPT